MALTAPNPETATRALSPASLTAPLATTLSSRSARSLHRPARDDEVSTIECAFAARTGVDTGKLPLLRLLPRRRGRLLPGRCASGCAPGGPLGGERGADASPRELLGRAAIVRRLAAMVSSSRFDGRGCREALAAHQCSVCEPVAVASLVCPGVAARLCLRLCCGCVPCVTSRRATETACDRFASGAPRRCFSFCGWSRDFLGRDLFVCRERREDCWGP